jgi:hypothetical protein
MQGHLQKTSNWLAAAGKAQYNISQYKETSSRSYDECERKPILPRPRGVQQGTARQESFLPAALVQGFLCFTIKELSKLSRSF